MTISRVPQVKLSTAFTRFVLAAMLWAGISVPLRAEDATKYYASQVATSLPATLAQSNSTGNASSGENDPLELLNRAIFDFNELVQILLLRPAGTMYRIILPVPVRKSVSNALDNLRSPIVLANDILQGEPERAWQTTQRLVINSTLGIVGLIDAAEKFGIPKHSEDFGQTLAIWGVGEGFYLVLPIFGPSNPRDAVGKLLVDGYFDPLNVWLDNSNRDAIKNTRTGVAGVSEYEDVMDQLEDLQKTSIDYYSVLRSLYRQKRVSEISNGGGEDLLPVPDLDYLDIFFENDG